MASKLLTPEQVDIHNEWRKADLAMSRALHKWGDTKTLEDYNAKEKAMDLENEAYRKCAAAGIPGFDPIN